MPKTFTVTVGDRAFVVLAGARLLDAALQAGVDLPHDCRAGQCGACAVELTRGVTLGGEHGAGTILACQARVFSDLAIARPQAPDPVLRNAVIEEIAPLAPDVVKLVLRPHQPIDWRPGQFMKLRFQRLPARSFSPTARLSDGAFDDRLTFHIKQVKGGLVTPRLGREIGVGARVAVEGPFGHAFLRDDHKGRIVLLGSGTGFAPIWAIAAAAQRGAPDRPVTLICGAKDARAFYMEPALRKAQSHPGTAIRIVIEVPHPRLAGVPSGSPADHLPPLSADDVVFAAGSPRMVEKARAKAERVGARFYADPFAPAAASGRPASGLQRMVRLFGRYR